MSKWERICRHNTWDTPANRLFPCTYYCQSDFDTRDTESARGATSYLEPLISSGKIVWMFWLCYLLCVYLQISKSQCELQHLFIVDSQLMVHNNNGATIKTFDYQLHSVGDWQVGQSKTVTNVVTVVYWWWRDYDLCTRSLIVKSRSLSDTETWNDGLVDGLFMMRRQSKHYLVFDFLTAGDAHLRLKI